MWQINFQIKPNKIILAGTVVSFGVNMRSFEVKFDEHKMFILVIMQFAKFVKKKPISLNQIIKQVQFTPGNNGFDYQSL